jgi:hypothetical protein
MVCHGQHIEVPATNPVLYPITIGGFNDSNSIEGFTFDMQGNLLIAGIT